MSWEALISCRQHRELTRRLLRAPGWHREGAWGALGCIRPGCEERMGLAGEPRGVAGRRAGPEEAFWGFQPGAGGQHSAASRDPEPSPSPGEQPPASAHRPHPWGCCRDKIRVGVLEGGGSTLRLALLFKRRSSAEGLQARLVAAQSCLGARSSGTGAGRGLGSRAAPGCVYTLGVRRHPCLSPSKF